MITIQNIRDMLIDADNRVAVFDAYDAIVTVLHAARTIDPEDAKGADLEAGCDWIERQMQHGVDMRKACLHILLDLEDFQYDMEEKVRKARIMARERVDAALAFDAEFGIQTPVF